MVLLHAAQQQKILNKILFLQKKSIRILVDLKFQDPVIDYSLYVFETVKCIKSCQLSCTKTNTRPYNTRNKFKTKPHHLEFFKKNLVMLDRLK